MIVLERLVIENCGFCLTLGPSVIPSLVDTLGPRPKGQPREARPTLLLTSKGERAQALHMRPGVRTITHAVVLRCRLPCPENARSGRLARAADGWE